LSQPFIVEGNASPFGPLTAVQAVPVKARGVSAQLLSISHIGGVAGNSGEGAAPCAYGKITFCGQPDDGVAVAAAAVTVGAGLLSPERPANTAPARATSSASRRAPLVLTSCSRRLDPLLVADAFGL